MQIKHPSSPTPSPDGRYLAFVWDEGGVWNLYLVGASGRSGTPVKLTTFPSCQMTDPFWSADGKAIYFPHAGELWKVEVANGKAASAARSTALRGSGFALSPNKQQLALVQSNKSQGADLLVTAPSGGSAKKVAHNDTSIGALSWSPDGKHILYNGGTKTIRHEQTPEYSGAKIIYTITERAGGTQYVASTGGGAPVPLQGPGGFGGARWVDAGGVFDRSDGTSRDKTLVRPMFGRAPWTVIHGARTMSSECAAERAASQPSPDGKWIMFLSDRDGWDHIYVMPAAGGEAVQLTKGKFEAWRPT